MPELQRLRADHAEAVLAFELANRAYFAAFISDRGDEFYDQFAERHRAMLAEQEAGMCAFHVLVSADGTVLGRFNLFDLEDGAANVGYRVARDVAGKGVATAAVRDLCQLAVSRYGLHTLRAATTHDNVASQRVLAKAGFAPAGPADPAAIGGRPGTWYERALPPAPRSELPLKRKRQQALADLLGQLAAERGELDTPEDQAEIARYMRLMGGTAEE